MKINMAEDIKALPIKAPTDIVATATVTQYVNLTKVGAGQVEIAINFGALASTDATGGATVTVEANDVNDTSSSDNNEGAIAFNYRLSAAVGTDSMGALTAATSAGAEVLTANASKLLLIYVDPAVAAKKFVRAVVTPTAEVTSTIFSATARFCPRKGGASQESAT
jgi:hypothetical protein